MTKDEADRILREHGQEHLLRFWDVISAEERAGLLEQISGIDFDTVEKMKKMLADKDKPAAAVQADMEAAPVSELDGEARDAAYRDGTFELRNGRVAALVVAGGQGTRLGFEGPKGCFAIGPISGESLFYFHARKLLALERRWGAPVPFYVMTSQSNDAATRKFFEDNSYFGLSKDNVFFFTQAMWPALDAAGRIILDAPGHIFMGPDGHGGTLSALKKSGALDDMVKRGIRSVYYFQVDNPMVDICDPAFIGYHIRNLSDISVKVCAKRDPNEGLGVVVTSGGKSRIVEYTELTPEQKNERRADGELRFKFGSVAIHVFSTDFLIREADAGLPMHIAHKKVPFVDEGGSVIKPASPNAFKFEKFIFDALADARTTVNLAFDRQQEFSPVKNADGSDSPETCRKDLSRKWAWWLESAGIVIPFDRYGYPLHSIEVDPCFADSPSAMKIAVEEGRANINPQGDILLKCAE